jgi:MFS family permease
MVKRKKKQYRFNFKTLQPFFLANLTSFAAGIAVGWPSPIFPLLQSTDSPFERPLTLDEISWIASVSLIGAMLGTPIFGWSANKFGRKTTLLISACPQMVSSLK